MDRREVLKLMGGAGVLAMAPRMADGVPGGPVTVDGLRVSMEGMFSGVRHTRHSFEEWIHLEFDEDRQVYCGETCRVVPVTVIVLGENEADCVRYAWADFLRLYRHLDRRDTLLWRVTPYVVGDESPLRADRSAGRYLRMRFWAIPHDLRQKHLFSPGGTISGKIAG